MDEFGKEIRFAARRLLKAPGFSLVVILLLALSIGATTVVFSIVDGVLLKELPFRDSEQLVMLQRESSRGGFSSFAPAMLVDFRTRLEGFSGAVGMGWRAMELYSDGEPAQVAAASVSSDFFEVLGVRPHLGRTFQPGEEGAAAEGRAVVVSHGFFLRHLGGDEEAVGGKVELNSELYEVIGVMPREFDLPESTDLWLRGQRDIPHPMQSLEEGQDITTIRGWSYFPVVARLEPGVTPEQGRAALTALQATLVEEFPDQYDEQFALDLAPLRDELVGDMEGQLQLLLGAVLAVLLIACANVTNLMLARVTARERETAIRGALGAGRGRLLLATLAESGVLACAGGALGTLLAFLGLDTLLSLAPGRLPLREVVTVDARVLLFALALSLGAALLSGLLPAWQLSSLDVGRFLNDGGRGGEGRRRQRLRGALVTLEVAAALVLLIGAGLLLRSLVNLRANNPGFQPEEVMMAQLDLPTSRYPEATQRNEFYTRMLEDVQRLPGVQGAAIGAATPFSGSMMSMSFEPEGYEAAEDERVVASFTAVSPGYFSALGIPVLEGRAFQETDLNSGQKVALISRGLAERYYDGDALGKRLGLGRGGAAEDAALIVGVVGDVRSAGLDSDPQPTFYQLYPEMNWPFMTLLVRTRGNPADQIKEVRARIRGLDPRLPTDDIAALTGRIDRTLAERRALLGLLGLFAGVALVLAAVGLYGLMSYSVRHRFQEIGIRMALGARRASVVALVVRQGLALAVAGVVLGLVGAVGITRVLGSHLYGIEATDPRTFGALAVLLVAVAALASYLPARRAARVDPNVALRME